MSRMGEWADEQDDRDLEYAAWHQHETELLRQAPAFLRWLDQLDADSRKEMNNGTHGESERRIDLHPCF